MKQRFPALLTAVFAVVALASAGWGFEQRRRLDDYAFEHRRAELLLAENTRLRGLLAQEKTTRAVSTPDPQREIIEKAVTEIRGLKFQKPVAYDVVTHATIKATLEKKIRQQYSDDELKNIAVALAALGLLERDYPLKQKFLDLMSEQVAAFYDQHEHKLFMFEDAKLASAQNRIILAHELTHALQDQHFGLEKLPLETKNNDDRAVAASALVEGDATLVMAQYILKNLSGSSLLESLGSMMTQDVRQIESAPRFIRETLLFPYVQGQVFCATIQGHGGWNALSQAFKRPPSSTTQILHPEKYLAEPREEPVAISWTDMAVLGKKPIADNVLGELGVRILISQWEDSEIANKAAAGWRGDRYLVFDDGKALVWQTRWQTNTDANEFSDALQRCWQKRKAAEPSRANRIFEIKKLAENEVVLIDAATQEWASALAERFLKP